MCDKCHDPQPTGQQASPARAAPSSIPANGGLSDPAGVAASAPPGPGLDRYSITSRRRSCGPASAPHKKRHYQHRPEAPRYTSREDWLDAGIAANEALADRLSRLGVDQYAKALRQCQVDQAAYLCSNCGGYSWHTIQCRQRLCAICAARKSAEQAKEVRKLAEQFESCKFITLTMRRVDKLAEGLDAIKEAWNRFRRLPTIARAIKGGFAAIEIVWRPETPAAGKREKIREGWHIHMHLLADSAYIYAPLLARLWGQSLRQAVGGKAWAMVDIQSASPAKLARYISKYITKPTDLADWPDHRLREFCTTIYKRRLITAFGKYYRLSLARKMDAADRPAVVCDVCGAKDSTYPARAGPHIWKDAWPTIWEAARTLSGGELDYTRHDPCKIKEGDYDATMESVI